MKIKLHTTKDPWEYNRALLPTLILVKFDQQHAIHFKSMGVTGFGLALGFWDRAIQVNFIWSYK